MWNREGNVKNCPVTFSCKFEMQKGLMVSQFLRSVVPKDATAWGSHGCDASCGSSTLWEHTLSSHSLILVVSAFFLLFPKAFLGQCSIEGVWQLMVNRKQRNGYYIWKKVNSV